MWKESYRIGIDRIDGQHIKLFAMADGLLRAIEEGAGEEAYREAVRFLKDYVVFHFRDEEEYQASIGYPGLEEHRRAHRSFTRSVLEFERRLEASAYDIRVVKDLMGTLTAWLIYHVAEADVRIAGRGEAAPAASGGGDLEVFSGSVMNVLAAMTGLDGGTLTERAAEPGPVRGEVFVSVTVTGAKTGEVVFGFSRELTLRLVEVLAQVELEEVDELVCSVLAELANITCGNAATRLAERGVVCDIRPPRVLSVGELPEEACGGMHIDTGIGGLDVAVRLR